MAFFSKASTAAMFSLLVTSVSWVTSFPAMSARQLASKRTLIADRAAALGASGDTAQLSVAPAARRVAASLLEAENLRNQHREACAWMNDDVLNATGVRSAMPRTLHLRKQLTEHDLFSVSDHMIHVVEAHDAANEAGGSGRAAPLLPVTTPSGDVRGSR